MTPESLGLQLLATHETPWTPADPSFRVALNLALDGAIVPTRDGAARTDYTRVLVFDGFLDDATRQQLLDDLTAPGWAGPEPPAAQWERATLDAAPAPGADDGAGGGSEGEGGSGGAGARIAPQRRTWGLRDDALRRFAASDLPAKLEVQSRLCRLYPEAFFAHMPSAEMQAPAGAGGGEDGAEDEDEEEKEQQQQQDEQQQPAAKRPRTRGPGERAGEGGEGGTEQATASDAATAATAGAAAPAVDCAQWVANAAVAGDSFSWHVDADPAALPDSPWVRRVGRYFNREPGRPVFVSLLVYLDSDWPRGHDAETLVLDAASGCGVFVRPKPGRAVLMHQDAVHRLSAPSAAAGRPRYSLVWKLVMLPRAAGAAAAAAQEQRSGGSGGGREWSSGPGGALCLARPEWGAPLYFGSARRLRELVEATAAAKAAGAGDAAAAGEAVAAGAVAAAGEGRRADEEEGKG